MVCGLLILSFWGMLSLPWKDSVLLRGTYGDGRSVLGWVEEPRLS